MHYTIIQQVRSYLAGNPGVKIKLCDNLVVGRQNSGGDHKAFVVLRLVVTIL